MRHNYVYKDVFSLKCKYKILKYRTAETSTNYNIVSCHTSFCINMYFRLKHKILQFKYRSIIILFNSVPTKWTNKRDICLRRFREIVVNGTHTIIYDISIRFSRKSLTFATRFLICIRPVRISHPFRFTVIRSTLIENACYLMYF